MPAPTTRWTALTVVLFATGLQGQSPTAHQVVARAVAAMGGDSAVRAVRSTSLAYQRATFGLGQAETHASPLRATFFSGDVHHDYVGQRRRILEEARPAPGQTMRFSQVMAGGVVHNDNSGGLSALGGPVAVANNLRLMRLSPERLLIAALDNPSALTALPARQFRGEPASGVRYAHQADTLNLWFDRGTGRLLATETVADDAVLGDRRTVTMFTRWNDAGAGVMLPRQVDVFANDALLSHTIYTSVRVNGSLADSLFAIPDSVVARAPRGTAPPPAPESVNLVALAPGVWRAEGGSHHSLVVEQGNQLLVVEAPLSAARFNAVLDTLRSRFPGRTIGGVVMSHHHWDHSGGVRAALAAGLPIVAHERNAAFVREVASAPKTVSPDALSRRPRAPVIRTVNDSLVTGSGDQRVVLYLLPNNHAEGMLAAWHPTSRLLFVVDVLSPGGNLPRVGSGEVAAMVLRHGLEVDRVVGGHGGTAPWADVVRAATPN